MKKRKAYKQKPIRIPKIVCAHNDFEQVDRLVLMIENDGVLEANGDVVMYSQTGELYQVAPALNTWCDYWQTIAALYGNEIKDIPLRNLINKINHSMPVKRSLIAEAKEVIEMQRKLFMNTDHNVISQKAIEMKMAL